MDTDSWLNKVMTSGCGGYGFVICYCGGDLCVCGLDGESCPGCDECQEMSPEETEEWESDWQESWERD